MSAASLDVATPAWRAGRAAAAIQGLRTGEVPADDVLAGLDALGAPPSGWWDILAVARASERLCLLLPRPGDPRGLALPRGLTATGALGWARDGGTTWLIPDDDASWRFYEDAGAPTIPDSQEALRTLRAAIVEAAHIVDALDTPTAPDGEVVRRRAERIIDSWILGPPPLPAASRALAALGLRMLLATEGARTLVDVVALESAARTAVEAAYSTAPGAH